MKTNLVGIQLVHLVAPMNIVSLCANKISWRKSVRVGLGSHADDFAAKGTPCGTQKLSIVFFSDAAFPAYSNETSIGLSVVPSDCGLMGAKRWMMTLKNRHFDGISKKLKIVLCPFFLYFCKVWLNSNDMNRKDINFEIKSLN